MEYYFFYDKRFVINDKKTTRTILPFKNAFAIVVLCAAYCSFFIITVLLLNKGLITAANIICKNKNFFFYLLFLLKLYKFTKNIHDKKLYCNK